ncbi:hypothetical protein HPB48_012128 [Haemaphysalis longicornis]|uniref:Uncharacterized protein n=1 Tax=Haemaphysalis longicornis TaxID=44386 RepID=A0A9J6FNH2_HAELO|nr:hypothetical protein HPB48_012128 [Haemaphysalis longicornis]
MKIGRLSFSIHQAAGISKQERANTFIEARQTEDFVSLATYRTSAANKLLALAELKLLWKLHTVTSHKVYAYGNTIAVLHGVASTYGREQIRTSLTGHNIRDFRHIGESHLILITIEFRRLPRQAIICSAITRLYPPSINITPCLHCLSLQYRADFFPTRKEFVRPRDCETKFPLYHYPTATRDGCKWPCFNCQGDLSATYPYCPATQAALQTLRDRTVSICNCHRYHLVGDNGT